MKDVYDTFLKGEKMNKRQTTILDLLSKSKKIEVSSLALMLDVSQVTIRKDLDALEKSGIIIREHGYAVLNDSDDINTRLAYHYEIKQKIARKAAETIHDGETLMIESGSCCSLLALEIAKTKQEVTLITNSAFIAEYVRRYKNIHVILLGGEYQKESQVMVGPITRNCAQNFYVDKLFIGADGFSVNTGFTGNDYMRAETVRDLARQAKKVIVVTDSSKFDQIGVVSLMDTKKVSMVYTDKEINLDTENYLKENQVEVIKV